MNDTVKLLTSHRSIRKYQARPVEEEKVRLIIESAQSASTSNFIQAYTIIRIEDKERRAKAAELAGNQPYIMECPLFLIFCADIGRHQIACTMHETEMAQGFTESFITATVDAALAAQNALIAAESMGLGGVYIGGIRNNPDEICRLLDIPENVYPVFGMCLGYPDENPEKKQRLPMEVVLKTDRYTTKGDLQKIEEYDEAIRQYYLKRTNGKRADTWSNMMARHMSVVPRPHMRGFLERHGFKMK